MDDNNQYKIQNNNKISNGSSILKVLLVLVIIGLIGAVAFAYREMSTMRRDLYAVRADYYKPAEDQAFEGKADEQAGDSADVQYELISQTVKELNVADMSAVWEEGQTQPKYKTAKVRVLEVKITNNSEGIFAYYDNVGALVNNGLIARNIQIDPSQNQNKYISEGNGSLELAPGGTSTIYIYINDPGFEIEKLYDLNTSKEI